MADHINEKSLQDVHASIDPGGARSKFKKLLAFFGPAYLVSVGYMDPGNWATDIAGGSHFGYALLWVLLMSNFMALLLQSLSARLGIVQGRDLAQCSRELYPPLINFVLYGLAEIAIAACDLAEILGMAIGLNLLFGLPLIWGVLVTLLDTFLLLYLQKLGMRKMEAFIIALIVIIGGCFLTEILFAKPDAGEVIKGLVPRLPDHAALYIAIGIIGATVMPHNLYLHSALVQTRKIGKDEKSIRKAIRFNILDSAIALNIAFLVNAAILILAGTVFYTSGNHSIDSIQDAHKLLAPLLGSKWAAILFAVALVAAGQSSTITGTLAGQIIMEGYLHLRLSPIARRLITRLLAIVPAVVVILIAGEKMVDDMLVFSQVLLSMQLAFAVIPLIHFVSDKAKMGVFTINIYVKILSWTIASIILTLNIKLFLESVLSWMEATNNIFIKAIIIIFVVFISFVLLVTIFYPLILKRKVNTRHIHNNISENLLAVDENQSFAKVALALDFTDKDQKVLQYAVRLAKANTEFILIHIVESASATVMGNESQDIETLNDKAYLEEYEAYFNNHGYAATAHLGFKDRVNEIARIVTENKCDLLIIGSHGHKTAKDWLFGETINSVRHKIEIPVFIAR
ncbi:MAG: Nramp family divalent metal transporter [Taibaiella sp.]|nr:Nramp family divalent metal transporter [Taibaiella sp.]